MIPLIKTMFNLPLCWQADGFSQCVRYISVLQYLAVGYCVAKLKLLYRLLYLMLFISEYACHSDYLWSVIIYGGFPSNSVGKASACNVGDLGSIPGLGRSPGEGNGNPLQDSCLENPMDRGVWWATVHGVAKSRTWLSDFTFTHYAEYIMRNAGLEEARAGIKIAGRNISNLRYADDTSLVAENEEELKSLLMKVK